MKNFLFILTAGLFLCSCSENTSADSLEEAQSDAFESYEYKTLQTSYDEYVEIEASITTVFDKKVTSKLSKSELDSRQEAYVQKLTQKMFEVKKKRDVFLTKYPNIKNEMSAEQLRNILREKTE